MKEHVPKHIAVIMDGNGRWANRRGLDISDGHLAGYQNIRPVISKFAQLGIKYVTIYAFSTENWDRPKSEVDSILELAGSVIKDESRLMSRENIRILHAGDSEGLPNSLRSYIEQSVEETKNNTGLTLCVAFNYGGRGEIIRAIKKIIREGIEEDKINETLLCGYMYTHEIPDPDLIIRTGGEFRLSNFLIWQSAYSEFHSTPVFWPDFGLKEINQAILTYRSRKRRFGRRQ